MSTKLLPGEALTIAEAGGGLKLPAGTKAYPTATLCQIVGVASESGARITITNSHLLSVDDMLEIAKAGPGHVSFE